MPHRNMPRLTCSLPCKIVARRCELRARKPTHEIFVDRLGLGHFDLLRRLVAHRHNDLLERALRLPLPANKLAVALLLVDCSQ